MPVAVSTKLILVVEDGDAEREALARFLRAAGYRVITARNPTEAMKSIDEPVDLVLSDLRMGGQTGIDLMRDWLARRSATPFVILTAFGAVDSAVAAMKLGAKEFLTKPVDPPKLLRMLEETLSGPSPVSIDLGPGFERIVGVAPAMTEVRQKTLRAARSRSTVLILGESGTGKELVAEAIHKNSQCADGPFVIINMAALPESLVESELFGHVKGAFTGATSSRVGKFQSAHGGTLFIDEIGDYPLHLQPKLLRVLENHIIAPVGGNDSIQVDVRVVAATSRPLAKMVEAGDFREDLYYRLNVLALQLPPLRERREDIPLLTQHFLNIIHKSSGHGPWEVSSDLQRELGRLSWPGNVRQFKNCLERMCVLAHGSLLTLDDLPADVHQAGPPVVGGPVATSHATLESLKKSAILQALERFGGNRTKAAEHLGISVRTLQRKLREWEG